MMVLRLKTYWFLLWTLMVSVASLTTTGTAEHVLHQEVSTPPGGVSADHKPDGTTLRTGTFKDSPEAAGRTSNEGTISGTQPTDGHQSSRPSLATSPIMELERNSTPVLIRNHSPDRMSTPQPPEPVTTSDSTQNLSSPPVPQTTATISLISTPESPELLLSNSVSGFGTTGGTSTDLMSTPQHPEPLTTSGSSQNLSSPTATKGWISTPESTHPSLSNSLTSESSQNISSPSVSETTATKGWISTPESTHSSLSNSLTSESSQNISSPSVSETTATKVWISTPESTEPSLSNSLTSDSTQNLSSPSVLEITRSSPISTPDPEPSSPITESSAEPSRSISSSSPTNFPVTTSTPLCVPSKDRPSKEEQSCSTRGVVKPCLIAIAFLAGLATFFMVSTIVLCTKLSTKKYQVRRARKADTEMTFMSTLLPERYYAGVRQRSPPVTNGVRVIPSLGDSDEDASDNLTLSSFLPESDRFV